MSKASSNAAKGLVPRLRFSAHTAPVSVRPLRAVADFVGERIATAQITVNNYASTENLLSDFGGFEAASSLPTTRTVTHFRVGDVLVSNIRPYLKKVWQADRDGGASNDVLVLRAKDVCSRQFLAAWLRSDTFIGYVMSGAKGVKMPRGDVRLIEGFPVPQLDAAEQQKIAVCLASLDARIAAETRQLDALRTHKQGLLQQLFPRENESVPRLRFHALQEAADWRPRPMRDLFRNRVEKGNKGLSIYSVTLTDGMLPRDGLERHIDDIADASKNKAVAAGDIAYNMMRMWQGACGVAPTDCMVSPAYVVLAPTAETHSPFFGALFKTAAGLRQLEGHSRGLTADRLRLYFDDFSKIEFVVPGYQEQQKIADCIASLDDLIASQGKKIDLLKQHKRGLMQQLFPSIGGVDGAAGRGGRPVLDEAAA